MRKVRRYERVFLFTDVAVQPNQTAPGRFPAKLFNVSKSGAGVFCRHHFAPGEIIGLEMVLPDPNGRARSFRLYGTVRHARVGEEGNVLGIEFVLGAGAGDYESFAQLMDAPANRLGPADTGFTLVEVCIAMTVVCLMATMAIPLYTRAVEQSRVDVASAKLQTVWSAERIHWLERRTFTPSMADLNAMDLLDPSLMVGQSEPGVVFVYQIVRADNTSFLARAVRTGSRSWTGSIEIDQTGRTTGAIIGPDGQRLAPAP